MRVNFVTGTVNGLKNNITKPDGSKVTNGRLYVQVTLSRTMIFT